MFFRKTFFGLLILTLAGGLIFAGCSPQEADTTAEADAWGEDFGPRWAMNLPEEENSIFGAGNARSRDLNNAIRRANLQATQQIAQAINQTIQSWEEEYIQEMGDAADGEILQASESLLERIVEEDLQGVREVERAVQEDEGVYNAWVLVELNFDDLENQFSEMERLETEFSREEARRRFQDRLDN